MPSPARQSETKRQSPPWSEVRRANADQRHSNRYAATDYVALLSDRSIPEPNSGCYLWTGYTDENGYGGLSYKGHRQLAHRVSLAVHFKVELGDLHVLHRCDNPSCINPDHLRFGTNADNVADMVTKKRHRVLKGSAAKQSKLSDDQIKCIRARSSNGTMRKDLAAEFGVDASVITRVVLQKTYKDAA